MKKKLQAELAKIVKKIRKDKALSIIKLILIGTLGLLGLILTAYQLAYRGRIYPGVTIANQPVGNKTVDEATVDIRYKILDISKLTLYAGEQQWEINLGELGFSYDATATAQKAYRVGRTGDLIKDFQAKTQAWFSGTDLGWEYRFNQDLWETQIATTAAQIFVPAIDPQIEIINRKIKIEPGKEGQELDKQKLISIINSQLARPAGFFQNATLNFAPIELPIIHTIPIPTEEQIENTSQRAEKFLNKKLTFIFKGTSWELEENELVGFLSFVDGFDQNKIASQAANLASVIDRPPQNAAFQFGRGKVTQFRPAAEGQTLEQKKAVQLIKVALEEIEKSAPTKVSADKEEEVINLPVVTTPPEITIDQVNDLGIKELLGQGVSYFWGSIPSRIHNIILASLALNGVLIPPGTIFSLNETLGEVSPATGYQSAFIIKEGRTILGDGGGVCQVSTTLFRAALNTGLPIIERHPHTYRVSYYEQGGFGPGLDATVWMPRVDLKFKNDTPAHILIQASADTKTMTLTYELYGTSDGRQTTISKPKVWDQTPPPPDLYQDDPTLPAGTVKRIERANWGAKVSVDWRVTRGDEILQERTFYSSYQPWQAIYLRGTGQ